MIYEREGIKPLSEAQRRVFDFVAVRAVFFPFSLPQGSTAPLLPFSLSTFPFFFSPQWPQGAVSEPVAASLPA